LRNGLDRNRAGCGAARFIINVKRLRARMIVRKLMGVFLVTSAMARPAMAATSAAIWDDEGGQLRFDDSALGTWCYAKNNQMKDMKDAKVYERNQNCFFRKPPDWIVIGPNGYRTNSRTCSMTNIARTDYFKNVVVSYRCEEFEAKRVWTEQVEMGFMSTDHLYITPRIGAPSR
jgi:hypothetical protein